MYLLVMPIGFCLSYFIIKIFFSFFFLKQTNINKKRIIFSVILVGLFSLIINSIFSLNLITNIELANRILHTIGGGFLAFMVCFLVIKDNSFSLNKIQFFLLSFLIVVAMGVFNEVIEFLIQNYLGQVMAPNINDTWLDLISNLVGIIIAAIIFVPFVNKSRLD